MSRKDSKSWIDYLRREEKKDNIAIIIIIIVLFILPLFI